MLPSRAARIALPAAVLAALAGAWWLTRTAPAVPAATYVGRAACLECHAAQGAAWNGSDHAKAMNPAEGAHVLGRFDGSTLQAHGSLSTFLTKEGRPWIRTEDADGALRDFPVTHTFGADPLQQYLVGFPRGRVQVPGLCWDSRPADQGGQRWFHLYPESEAIRPGDALHWTGPSFNWNFMCAECHVTGYRKDYDAAGDRFRSVQKELNVSCESCHGPGSRHLEWAKRKDRDEDETRGLEVLLKGAVESRWVFDPGQAVARPSTRRPNRAEVETCGRCHARRGRVLEDDRHGRPLADAHRVSLLEENLYHADGQILDEVYEYGSFLQSKMHRASVTCSNCHDPHAAKLRLPGNALCGQCHQPAVFDTPAHHRHKPEGKGASCVECHMPARTYMGVDSRRDHSFRVPRPDLSVRLGTPNACTACHAEKGADWAAQAVASWRGGKPLPPHYGEVLHAGRTRAPGAAASLAALAGQAEAPPIVRGTALSLLGRFPGEGALAAARAGLKDEEILVRQGALAALAGADPATAAALAGPLLSDPVGSLRLMAVDLVSELPADRMPPELRGPYAAARKEWLASQRFNADRPEAQLNLGQDALREGRVEDALAAFRRARDLLPALAAPHAHLADTLARAGRPDEAEAALREGLKKSPDEAPLRHALGLQLVRSGRKAEAVGELERAAKLAPRVARYAFVHAVGVESLGERPRAIRLLEEALQSCGDDAEILQALAEWAAKEGDAARARQWEERLRSLR